MRLGRSIFAIALTLSPVKLAAAEQRPLVQQQPLSFNDSESHFYEFKWPIRKVAVIGAGVGGLINYRTLLKQGYDVQLFERDCHPGGVWHYTEDKPLNAPVPNLVPAVADYSPSLPPIGKSLPYEEVHEDVDPAWISVQRRAHHAPKPVWDTLKSNAPHVDQQIPELHWPEDLPWEISQKQLSRYVRAFASYHGVNTDDGNPNVFYNTRVELIEKRYVDGKHIGWKLTLKEFIQTGEGSCRIRWWTNNFDAVVIATGRYNSPSMAPISGLAEWNGKFPEHIHHSRQYRRPEEFKNKSVLIIGAASSGAEIGAEINPYASKVYVSTRPDTDPHPHYPLSFFLPFLPKNTTMIGEIKQFHSLKGKSELKEAKIELVNGTVIEGVDEVILCTGFRYTYPFLPQYLDPTLGPNDTAPAGSPQPLVTDGSHVRSLHLDVFYIEEPTLGFVNVNGGMQSFVYAEYIAAALSSVWKNHAKLPSTSDMWRTYEKRVKEQGGFNKYFLFLGSGKADVNMRYFVSWVNEAAVRYGDEQINGPSKAAQEMLAIWSMARFGSSAFNDAKDKPTSGFVNALDKAQVWDDDGMSMSMSWEEKKKRALDAMYIDHWW